MTLNRRYCGTTGESEMAKLIYTSSRRWNQILSVQCVWVFENVCSTKGKIKKFQNFFKPSMIGWGNQNVCLHQTITDDNPSLNRALRIQRTIIQNRNCMEIQMYILWLWKFVTVTCSWNLEAFNAYILQDGELELLISSSILWCVSAIGSEKTLNFRKSYDCRTKVSFRCNNNNSFLT